MTDRPARPIQFTAENAARFAHQSVVRAYVHRPPYPAETFAILAGLMAGETRAILDVGCGPGKIARSMTAFADRVDAVDPSAAMLALGQMLPGGDDPHIQWLQGHTEDIALTAPYALITAGESLHWMEWEIVLPRFADALLPGGVLAIVHQPRPPYPWWDALAPLIPQYSTYARYETFDLIAFLEEQGLFTKRGERETTPMPFAQSVENFVAYHHSMSSFDHEVMTPTASAAFDDAIRAVVSPYASNNGMLAFPITAKVVWGNPHRR